MYGSVLQNYLSVPRASASTRKEVLCSLYLVVLSIILQSPVRSSHRSFTHLSLCLSACLSGWQLVHI